MGRKNRNNKLDIGKLRKNYLDPALDGGWIGRTQPDFPRSPTQRYRLTDNGRRWLKRQNDK